MTEWDPPRRLSLRGRIMPGSILDTTYEITAGGDGSTLRMSKVAVGPMTEEEASGIRRFGDIANFEDGLAGSRRGLTPRRSSGLDAEEDVRRQDRQVQATGQRLGPARHDREHADEH